jgi:hypothetical protein
MQQDSSDVSGTEKNEMIEIQDEAQKRIFRTRQRRAKKHSFQPPRSSVLQFTRLRCCIRLLTAASLPDFGWALSCAKSRKDRNWRRHDLTNRRCKRNGIVRRCKRNGRIVRRPTFHLHSSRPPLSLAHSISKHPRPPIDDDTQLNLARYAPSLYPNDSMKKQNGDENWSVDLENTTPHHNKAIDSRKIVATHTKKSKPVDNGLTIDDSNEEKTMSAEGSRR